MSGEPIICLHAQPSFRTNMRTRANYNNVLRLIKIGTVAVIRLKKITYFYAALFGQHVSVHYDIELVPSTDPTMV